MAKDTVTINLEDSLRGMVESAEMLEELLPAGPDKCLALGLFEEEMARARVVLTESARI